LTGTIKGVHPVEAVGMGLEKASEFSNIAGRKLSQVLTGDPDTLLKNISLVPQVPTYLSGKILTGTGRLLRDAGRQIDKQGMRGRKGLAEKIGGDARSSEFNRRLFGTTKGGLMRARSADWIGRYTGAMTRAGTSGAALNVMLGLPEIENPTQLGQSLGTGVGIGLVMGSDPVGRVSALLDPTTNFSTKIDQFIDPDPVSRRADEDADIARFMDLADENVKSKINAFSDVNARIATLDGQIKQFQTYRDSTKNSREWKFWQDEMNTLTRHRNLLDQNKNNKQFTDEVQRQVTLDFADALEQLKAIGNQAGLGSPSFKILDDANAEEEIRKIWGKTLADAEFFRSQIAGKPTLEPNEAELLQKAEQTIKLASDMVEAAKSTRGFALHKNHYINQPAHLIPANLDSPIVALNGNLLSHLGREGFNPGHTLRHESFHVLKQFKEVRDALGLEQLEQQMFGRKIKDDNGQVIAEIPGIYSEAEVMRYGQNYAARMGGQSFIDQFDSVDKFLEYIREEMLVENYATSGNVKGGLRAAADSPGQALVDWIEAKTRNGSLKQLKEALRSRGIIFDSQGQFSTALGAKIDPESSALMRRVTRLIRDEIGSYTFETDGLNPDGTEKVRDDGDIPWAVVMSSPALQEQYISDDRFVKDQVLAAYDDAGNKISEVVLPDGVGLDPYIAQYYMKDGKIVDEAGNEIVLGQPVNLSALPNGSKVETDFRIRRNPDGTPVVISPREANARATKRGKIIYDAIITAPEDGMPKMRDVDNNGVLTGVLSPAQLQAVLNLPNNLVPARLKRIIAEGNAMLQRKDGTRAIIDYQAVYRGGKARSLAPRVRDIVPLSWRISQKQNFLFTSISVSRMFDKLNVWSSKFPENLTLWNGDTFSFWQDLLKVLNNHNAGLTGDGKNSSNQYVGERLDADDAVAELKKHRVNDFFNLFDKGTEALNPMRTKIKAKKGQDSPDRLIMSARVDRINHFQESASTKLPVDYGKMKINFMPNLNYTVPSDPRTLMADFYLINYLSGFSDVPFQGNLAGLSETSLAKYSGENPEAISFLRSEDYRPIVKVTQDRLQTFLKEHLLDQVFFSLSAEIRHAIKRSQDPAIYGPIMNQYIKYFSAYDAPSPYEGRKPGVPEEFKTSESIRKKSWQATTRALENYGGKDFAKARRKDLALEMAKVFREGAWSSGYGGEKWAQIAEAFVLLHYANTPEKIAFAIDKVYDLQHNTNTVFNKIERYAKDGGYSWVMEMLDFKYHLKNPRELLPLVSSDLKKLALPVLKDFGNATAPTKEFLQKVATDEVGPEAVGELTEFIQKMKPGYSIYPRIGVSAPKESGRDFSTELSKWLQSKLTSYAPKKSEIITREDGTQYAVDVKPPKAFIELAQLLISEKMGSKPVGVFASKEMKQIFENVKNQNLAEQSAIENAQLINNSDEPQQTDAGVKISDDEILQGAQDLVTGKKNTFRVGEYSFKLENSSGYDPQGDPYSSTILVAVDESGAAIDEIDPLAEGLVPTSVEDYNEIALLYSDFIKASLGIKKKQTFLTTHYLNFLGDTLIGKNVGQKTEFQVSTPNGLATYIATNTGQQGTALPVKTFTISKKGSMKESGEYNPDETLFEISGTTAEELKGKLKENFRALEAGVKLKSPAKPEASAWKKKWKSQMLDALQTQNIYKSNTGPVYSQDQAQKLLEAIVDEKTGELTTDLSFIQTKSGVNAPYSQQADFIKAAIGEAVKLKSQAKPEASAPKEIDPSALDEYVADNFEDFGLEFYDVDNLITNDVPEFQIKSAIEKYKSLISRGTFKPHSEIITLFENTLIGTEIAKAIDQAIKNSVKEHAEENKTLDAIYGTPKPILEGVLPDQFESAEDWKTAMMSENAGYYSDAEKQDILDAIINPNTGEVAQNLQQVWKKTGIIPPPPGASIAYPWVQKAWSTAHYPTPAVTSPKSKINTWFEKSKKTLMSEYWDSNGYFGGAFSMDDLIPVLKAIVNPDTGEIETDADKVLKKSGIETSQIHFDKLFKFYKFIEAVTNEALTSGIKPVSNKKPPTPANEPVFGTTDPYVYHLTSNDPDVIASITEKGILPSKRGYSGPGVYFGNTPENTQVYDDLDSETSFILRVNKNKLLDAFGQYSQVVKMGLQFDPYNGEVYLSTDDMGALETIPPEWLEYKNSSGVWVPLVETKTNKSLQEPTGEKELYQMETEDGESGFATDDLFSFNDAYGSKKNILEYWKEGVAWPPGVSGFEKLKVGGDPWKLKLFKRIKTALGDSAKETSIDTFGTAYAEEILNIHESAWDMLQGISAESFQKALDLATMQDLNSIIQATSFEPELYQEYLRWSKPDGTKNPPASFMPSEEYGLESGEKSESRLTPKTLYNLYYISTEGDPGNEYGRSLQNEYIKKYKDLYLNVFSDLVKNQINKYIRRGRVDPFVTKEALKNAKSASQLDELMRGTYRSDMRRRNDVWNLVTEFLKGLESAQTRDQRLFYMDRLNNAIHNTDELLFSKFSNASDLMAAFNLIANARDVRAYSRNVDRDLRLSSDFGGPAGSFMPTVLSEVGLTPEHMQSVNAAFRDRNRLKDMVARYVKTGNENDFAAIAADPVFSVFMQEQKPRQGRSLPSAELSSWLRELNRSVKNGDAADIKRARSSVTRLLNDPKSFNTKEIAEIISNYVNENRQSNQLWRIEGAAPYTGEPVESFRGIALNGPLIEGLKVGDTLEVDSSAYESWSTDPKVAIRFATKISNTGMDMFGSTMQWLRNKSEAEKENRKGLPGDYGLVLSTVLDSDSVAIDVSELNASSRYVNESELIARPGKKLVTIAAIYRDYGEDSTPERVETSIYADRDFTIELDPDSVENKLMAHARRNWRNPEEYGSYVEKSSQIRNAVDSNDTSTLVKLLNETFAADDIEAEALGSSESGIKVLVKNTNPLNVHRYFGKGESLSKVAQGIPSFMPTQAALNRTKKNLPKHEINITERIPKNKYDGPREAFIFISIPKGEKMKRGTKYGESYLDQYEGADLPEDEKRIIGFAHVYVGHEFDAKSLAVEFTNVAKPYRGAGYGQALYRAVARYAQKTGMKYLYAMEVSPEAAAVRNKLFEEKPRKGERSWSKGVEGVDPRDLWPFERGVGGMRSVVPPNISYMPTSNPDLSQVTLDERKAKLPEVTFKEISEEYELDEMDEEEMGDEVSTPKAFKVFNKKGKEVGQFSFFEDSDSIVVNHTFVNKKDRNKGYGEQIYRELARIAQRNDASLLVSDQVSESAAKTRRKLFEEEETMDGMWENDGEAMVSAVAPNISYMPTSLDGVFYHGVDKNKSGEIPKTLSKDKSALYPAYEEEQTPVTYLTPDPGQALYYSSEGDVFAGNLVNQNIFDPSDEEDIKKVAGTDKQIRKELEAGKDKVSGGGSVEFYAKLINQAGFDGYIAWESNVPTVGIFTDKVDLGDFYLEKDADSLDSDFMPEEMGPPINQDGPGLAETALPNTDRGPLSKASYMPGYNPR